MRISDQIIPVLICTEATLEMGMLSSLLPKNLGLIRRTRSGPTSIRVRKKRFPLVNRLAKKTSAELVAAIVTSSCAGVRPAVDFHASRLYSYFRPNVDQNRTSRASPQRRRDAQRAAGKPKINTSPQRAQTDAKEEPPMSLRGCFFFLRVRSVLCGEIFVFGFGFPAVLCASLRLCGGFSRKGKSVP